MGLLFRERTPCYETEHLYAIEKEFDSRSVTLEYENGFLSRKGLHVVKKDAYSRKKEN